MFLSKHGVKSKEKEKMQQMKQEYDEVSPKGTNAAAKITSAQACSTTAAHTISKHNYICYNTRSQSPELSPLPESDPDTPAKHDQP